LSKHWSVLAPSRRHACSWATSTQINKPPRQRVSPSAGPGSSSKGRP
jgi:hypothetical protein